MNEWVGPIESSFGHHIILVSTKTDGYYPDIRDILKQVEVDLLQNNRDKAVEEYINQIKLEYKVYINPNLQI